MLRRPGYTLIELIVTVIIIAVISGLAINNFLRALEQGYERDAIMTMKVIASSLEIERRTQGHYPTTNLNGLNAINNALNLKIPGNDFINSYQYTYIPGGGGDPYYILDVGTVNGWSVSYDHSTLNHYCSAGTCPTCDASGCSSADL